MVKLAQEIPVIGSQIMHFTSHAAEGFAISKVVGRIVRGRLSIAFPVPGVFSQVRNKHKMVPDEASILYLNILGHRKGFFKNHR
jgi:hypothetical protein